MTPTKCNQVIKLAISVFLILFFFLKVEAQWVSQKSNTSLDILDIKFLDDNNGFFCGKDGIFKSVDGGTNWSRIRFKNADSTIYKGCIFRGIHFFSSTSGLAAGWNLWSNAAIIIKTTDGGLNWTTVHTGQAQTSLNDIKFISSTTGFAVGDLGVILKSTDSGTTWTTVNSGTTQSLKSVDFLSSLTGCIVGENVILRTTNTGASWSLTTYTSCYFKALKFSSSGFGYAAGDNGLLMKTLDSGATWNAVTTKTTYNFSDVFFTNTDYYLSGNSGFILKADGSGLWEKQNLGNEIYTIYYINSTTGFAAGKNGILFKTTNNGGIFSPISYFQSSATTYCSNTGYSFVNSGPGSYTYKWLINGAFYTNSQNLNYMFPNGNANYTISLISSNSSKSDTFKLNVYVQPALNINLQLKALIDTLCPNSTGYILVQGSESGTVYQLRNGTTNIGSSKVGNGNTLTFSTGILTTTTNFNIIATKTNTCGSFQSVGYQKIEVSKPKVSLHVYSERPIICKNDSAVINIDSTISGTQYQLYNGANAVGVAVYGNGTTMSLYTNKLTANTTFTIHVTDRLGCTDVLSQQQLIEIQNLKANFTISALNNFIGDTLYLDNLSIGNTFNWKYVPAPGTISGSEAKPSLVYPTTGEKKITLIAQSASGCMDSISTTIHVFKKASESQGTYCFFDTITQNLDISYSPNPILDYHTDIHGNSYVAGTYHHPYGVDGKECMFLRKYNANGKLVWEKVQNPYDYSSSYYGYQSSFITGVTTDEMMNVYITGSFSAKEFKIDNVSFTSKFSYFDKYENYYIAKLDSNGTAKWIICSDEDNSMSKGGTDILYVNKDKIYVSIYNSSTGYFTDGTSHYLDGELSIVEIDSAGRYKNSFPINSMRNEGQHITILNPSYVSLNSWRVATSSPKLELSNDGKIMVVGKFQNYMKFGNIKLTSICDNINFYVARLDPANGWENARVLYGRSMYYRNNQYAQMPVYAFDGEDNIYVAELCDSDEYRRPLSLKFSNGTTVIGGKHTIISKFDKAGNLLWYTRNMELNVRSIQNHGNDIILFGEYKNFLGIESKNNNDYGFKSKGSKDLSLVSLTRNGSLNWMDNIGSKGSDDALYLSKNACGDLFILGNLQDTTKTKYATLNYRGNNLFILKFDPDGICTNGCNCIPYYHCTNVKACEQYIWREKTLTNSGIYRDTLKSILGCDSIEVLYLTIGKGKTYSSLNVSACKSYTWFGNTYNSGGTYTHTLTNSTGCDSIITLNLTILNSLEVFVLQQGNTLNTDYQGGSYQWIDCSTGAPVNGATNSSYIPAKSGTYAVIVNNNNCLDTSACYPFIFTSEKGIFRKDNCRIYPNPSHGVFTLELIDNETGVSQIEITTLTGKTIYSRKIEMKNGMQLKFNLPEHGVYFITISGEKNSIREKIIVE